MQVIKIIKDTSKSRVFFYGKSDTLLFSADATASFSAEHTHKTVSINFEVEGSLPASFGWASDLIYLGVDATPPVLQTGTFDAFLTALKDTYFSQSASGGGGGGGGGGDASAANQIDQLARQGTTSDSPATNPNGAATQIALEKGIFGNGLKFKDLELVMEEGTGIEYYRAVDFDPNTPPTSTTYIDPNTGLITTPPTNSVYPVVSTLGVGRVTDALELNSGANASLVSVSKGLLDFAGQTNAAIGTGGDATVLDPDLGGSAIGILKGLLSVAGLSIGQKIDLGLLPGASVVHKSGKNFDIDTATLPESVWNGGGFYTGFPLTHTTTVQAVSSSALDIGTLTVLCLETDTSTEYTTQTIAVNGTTPVNSTFNVYRIHSASYASTANVGTKLNAGTITVRSTANPLTVFVAMPIGRNQSYMSGYTIPFGKRGYVMGTKWRVGGAAGNFIEGAMFIRPKNGAPRDRRNCTVAFGAPATDEYDGFIIAEAGTDIMPIITTVNANNVAAEAAYDIILLPA